MSDLFRANLQAYISFYESLTKETVSQAASLVTEDFHFKDPFNDTTGLAGFTKILEEMFEDTDEPRFKIKDSVVEHDCGFLTWTFSFYPKNRRNHGPLISIEGASKVVFAADGKLKVHLDYWDTAQLYQHFPVVKYFFRYIKRRLGTSS